MVHQVFDKAKRFCYKIWYGSEIKKKKVTIPELEENAHSIHEAMKAAQIIIKDLQDKIAVLEVKLDNHKIERNVKKREIDIAKIHGVKEEDLKDILQEFKLIDSLVSDEQVELNDLKEQLNLAHEGFGILQSELQKQEEIIKKNKERRHLIAPTDALKIGAIFVFGIFVIGLERENPRFIKLSEFILKLFPMR